MRAHTHTHTQLKEIQTTKLDFINHLNSFLQ